MNIYEKEGSESYASTLGKLDGKKKCESNMMKAWMFSWSR